VAKVEHYRENKTPMRNKFQLSVVIISMVFSIASVADDSASAGLRSFVLAPVSVEEADAIPNSQFTYPHNSALSEWIQQAWLNRMLENGVPENQYAGILEWYSPATAQEFVDKVFPDTGFKANNIIDVMTMELLIGLSITKQLDSIPLPIQIDLRNSLKKRIVVRETIKDHTDKRIQEVTEWTLLDVIEFALNRDRLTRGSAEFDSLIARVKEDLNQRGYRAGMVAFTKYGLEYRRWVDEYTANYMAVHGEGFDKAALNKEIFAESDRIELEELGVNAAD